MGEAMPLIAMLDGRSLAAAGPGGTEPENELTTFEVIHDASGWHVRSTS
jgi:hypothetical protein